MKWLEWLQIREGDEKAIQRSIAKKKTPEQNRELRKLNAQAGSKSGMPGFQAVDKKRKELLKSIEDKRSLSKKEFIDLYGYEAWLEKNKNA
jgi:hypothetical protein